MRRDVHVTKSFDKALRGPCAGIPRAGVTSDPRRAIIVFWSLSIPFSVMTRRFYQRCRYADLSKSALTKVARFCFLISVGLAP